MSNPTATAAAAADLATVLRRGLVHLADRAATEGHPTEGHLWTAADTADTAAQEADDAHDRGDTAAALAALAVAAQALADALAAR